MKMLAKTVWLVSFFVVFISLSRLLNKNNDKNNDKK